MLAYCAGYIFNMVIFKIRKVVVMKDKLENLKKSLSALKKEIKKLSDNKLAQYMVKLSIEQVDEMIKHLKTTDEQAKLTIYQVEQIVKKYSVGDTSFKKLSKEYGVSSSTIQRVIIGDSYKGIERNTELLSQIRKKNRRSH